MKIIDVNQYMIDIDVYRGSTYIVHAVINATT